MKNKIIMFFALLVMLVILIVLGQFVAAFALMKHLEIPVLITEIKPNTMYSYFDAYKNHEQAGNVVKLFFAGSFAPAIVTALITIIAIFVKESPLADLHGNASFATLKDLKDADMAFSFSDKKQSNKKWPAVLLGQFDDKTYVSDFSQEYTALAAPPGAGKGVSFVIPNLLNYPESILNFDPKAENFMITAGYREKVLGQKVFRFSPDDKPQNLDNETTKSNTESHCWNPLDYINHDPNEVLADIKKITTLLIPAPDGENQSFYQGAQKALNGIILYLIESEEEEKTIYRAWEINNHPAGIEKWITSTVAKKGDKLSSICKNLLMAYANESEKKRDTTKSIIDTNLDVFTDAKTRAATSRSDFDFNDLRRKKISIFVCIAPTNIPRYQTMLNLFFSQALSVNTETLPESDPSLKYQCLALLDEFVALGKIELIRSSAGYTRAYNMRYAIIFQNMSQVSSVYTKEGAQSLLETFHNFITFAVPSPEEAAAVSAKLGDTTIRVRDKSITRQSGSGSSTLKWETHKRPLMLPQEIQYLPYEEEIVFKGGGRIKPIHCKKIVWYKDKNFKDKANMELPKIPALEYV